MSCDMRFPTMLFVQQAQPQISLRIPAAWSEPLPLLLAYSMSIKLLTQHHLEFLSLKGGCTARLSLHLSKCHIVGNHMSWLIYCLFTGTSQPYNPLLSNSTTQVVHTPTNGISVTVPGVHSGEYHDRFMVNDLKFCALYSLGPRQQMLAFVGGALVRLSLCPSRLWSF